MKKSLLSVGAASLAIAMFATGCSTTNNQEANNELQEFLIGSRAAEHIEKTNDNGIDALASSSTIIYKRVGGSMREYIEKTRGDMATITLGRQIRSIDMADEVGIQKAKNLLNGTKLTDVEKKDWTAEKLYAVAKSKRALQSYIKYKTGLTEAEDKAAFQKKYEADYWKAELSLGEKEYQNTLAKEDWTAKIAELEKLLKDLGKITENTAVLAQDIAQKITAKGNDIAGLAQDPAMQNFVKETAPLVAQKIFAGAEKKKAIDAEIDKIAAKPEYKPIMEKKAQYAAELEKLQKDAGVLSDGVGKQVAFTGKAIPWLIKEYTAASKLK